MLKRVVALVLCLASVLLCLTACAKDENDKGAYIRMYLTEPVWDVDPLEAFDNEATLQIVSLLFEGLFVADENGKPKKALVEDYEYTEDSEKGEYILSLTLGATKWSDGVAITANDAQFAFRRLFYPDVSHPAAALLYDIKNARAIAEGNDSVDHLGVTVVDNNTLEILFETPIDLDEFLLTLCSPALYPLRDDIIDANPDWGKKSSSIITSGPFMVRSMDYAAKDGFILERNSYYYRDRTKDDIDKYVTPYRIIVDYSTDLCEQLKKLGADEAGAVYYYGRIPLAARKDGQFAELLEDAKITNAPSTHVYYLNHNALINNGAEGEAIFAKPEVRKALSLAIDRNVIVDAMVYATAADGLVPYTLLNEPGRKTEFREKAESYIAASANLDEAKALLSSAGVNANKYSFTITVAAYDEDHLAMADLVKAAWSALGFNVTVKSLSTYEIIQWVDKDENPNTAPIQEATGIYANPYKEALASGNFEVIALDLVATSPDAFGYLAPFATAFSGNAINMDITVNPNYELTPHITGYKSDAYNAKIEEAQAAFESKERAERLHEAEKILMEDMPVIPIVYNQNVALSGGKISKIDSSFFCNAVLTETKLSGYWKIALRDEFVTESDEEEAEEETAE